MKRSKHNLSHYRLCDINMGGLYPVSCMEVLPGDSFRMQSTALIRMATLATPVMHPVNVRIHHWFVPNRLHTQLWENFITGKDPEANIPTMNASTDQGLLDYLGIAPHTGVVNEMPVRAYNTIWNEFYRDQDIDTPRAWGDTTIAKVSWQKDYFTTARPYPTQNDETFFVPFQGSAPVEITAPTGVRSLKRATGTGADAAVNVAEAGVANEPFSFNVDLDASQGGIDVNDIRRAFALQRFAEARNRYGSRYVDYLRYLGVRPSDGRLDRPEYLGGGKQTVSFSEVLATADGTETKLGDYAGHGIAAVKTRTFRRFFEEHGFVISLLSMRPKTIYMDQVPKQFLRTRPEDYWQKEYEALGDQAVTNREVYAPAAAPDDVFGYVQRFRDYREEVSGVAGAFRTTLSDWHFGREFTASPNLNTAFIECNPDLRPFASQNDPQAYCMIAHRVAARRLVSKRARH